MTLTAAPVCTAFAGHRPIAAGPLADGALKAKAGADAGRLETLLLFKNETGQLVQLDLRGSVRAVVTQLAAASSSLASPDAPRVGRPRLGVAARDAPLPWHRDWRAEQPCGASAAPRRLVAARPVSVRDYVSRPAARARELACAG